MFHIHTKQQTKLHFFYLLVSKLLDRRRDNKRFWTEW